MGRVTNYRCDPELTDILIGRSFETLKWMRGKGVRFQPSYGRQAFKVNGKYKFWGGLAVEAWGGGPGLVDLEHQAAVKAGIPIHYETPALALIEEDGIVRGAIARHKGRRIKVGAKAVVLACGGFESNAEMRTRYLGPTWDLAKVRGTRFNTGAGITMALAVGAMPWGHWSGGHAVGWDLNAPPFGDLEVGDNFQKHSYPLGIMVNANGQRFVDEGADFRNYTYAKYGAVILAQPQQFAWQIFDAKVLDKLRDEYRIKRVTKVRADTHRGAGREARRCRCGAIPEDHQGMERRGDDRRAVQPGGQGRPRRARTRGAEEQLGQHHRHAAVRGLCRDLRAHLHLRRAEDHDRRRGREHRRPFDPRPVRGGRAGRRTVLSQLSRRHRAGVGRGARPARGRLRWTVRVGQELTMETWPEGAVFTVGHSTLPIDAFVALLLGYGIGTLADIRTVPRSRHNPQFNSEALDQSLSRAGVSYVALPGLGGLRRPRTDSPNGGWRNESFRGYADYMQTPAFEAALQRLIDMSRAHRAAIMCAEAVPWRCHRSLVADALNARGIPAVEILSARSHRLHKLTAFAAVHGTTVTYPPAQGCLL